MKTLNELTVRDLRCKGCDEFISFHVEIKKVFDEVPACQLVDALNREYYLLGVFKQIIVEIYTHCDCEVTQPSHDLAYILEKNYDKIILGGK